LIPKKRKKNDGTPALAMKTLYTAPNMVGGNSYPQPF